MALDLLGLEYKYVEVAVMEGAIRTPEYLSMNPQHTVPVLTDGNLVITDHDLPGEPAQARSAAPRLC